MNKLPGKNMGIFSGNNTHRSWIYNNVSDYIYDKLCIP